MKGPLLEVKWLSLLLLLVCPHCCKGNRKKKKEKKLAHRGMAPPGLQETCQPG